jgi:phage N-6-adenine-methyltransferase
MTKDSVHFSSQSNEWTTPQAIFDELNQEFGFNLDPASTDENAKCSRHFTEKDDGLSQDWSDANVFLNPPYGRKIGKWIKKAYESNAKVVVALIPSRTDTSYFHDYILDKAEIRFIRGRLYFGVGTGPAPFPSMIIIWRNNKLI